MSTGAGELALEHLERLLEELQGDLSAIEQKLAELESDRVVEKSQAEELISAIQTVFRTQALQASENSAPPRNDLASNVRDYLLYLLKQLENQRDNAGGKETLLETYREVRNRMMSTINAVELVIAVHKQFLALQNAKKAPPSVKIETSSTAPGSRAALGSSAIIRSQELERQRIAREIHDGPAQAIANVVLRMDILSKVYEKDPSKAIAEISKMKEIAQGALDEIRGFIFDLRPMTLQDLGLVATLKRIVTSLKEMSGIDVRFVQEGEERNLGQLVTLAVFRIAQEALNNLKKYSKCKIAWVHLKYLNDKVVLIVEDDGVGFDVEEVSDKSKRYVSFGLLGMHERAHDINAELQITSSPGHGTKVVLVVPTENNPALEVSWEEPTTRAVQK